MSFNDFSRDFKSGFDYIHDYDYSQVRESLYYMLFQDINDPYPYFASALIFENLYKTYPTIKTSIILYNENLNNLFTKSNGIFKSEINWNYFFDYKFSLPSFFEILHLTIGKGSLDILSKYKENLLYPFLKKYKGHFSDLYYERYNNSHLLYEISQVLLEINKFPIKELIKINKNFGWDYDRKNFKSSGIHWNYILKEINKSANEDKYNFSFINKLINLFLRQHEKKVQQEKLKDDYTRINLESIYISPNNNSLF